MQALIRQYDIVEYAQLMDFLQDEEMNVEYEVASNNTLFFDRYIGSRRHAPRIPKCDPKTGEVMKKKRAEKLSFCVSIGAYYDPLWSALCFVTLFAPRKSVF